MAELPKEGRGANPGSTKKKVTLYFNAPMLAETQREAIRQDRSISWIIQAAWKRAREEIKRLPSVGRSDAPDTRDETSPGSKDGAD